MPNDERLFYIRYAYEAGMTTEDINSLSHIDPWFLENIRELGDRSAELRRYTGRIEEIPDDLLRQAKADGFSDRQLAFLTRTTEEQVYELRHRRVICPTYKLVDTCAGELNAAKPYFYSTYEQLDENRSLTIPKGHRLRWAKPHRPGYRVRLLL